mmetsp:Transcript_25796/g.70881  ORF Transcript_25796/g.70881 Transcript_25796/m.70881 type:complete len:243 (-) Transcript_25796:796-1524(-)
MLAHGPPGQPPYRPCSGHGNERLLHVHRCRMEGHRRRCVRCRHHRRHYRGSHLFRPCCHRHSFHLRQAYPRTHQARNRPRHRSLSCSPGLSDSRGAGYRRRRHCHRRHPRGLSRGIPHSPRGLRRRLCQRRHLRCFGLLHLRCNGRYNDQWDHVDRSIGNDDHGYHARLQEKLWYYCRNYVRDIRLLVPQHRRDLLPRNRRRGCTIRLLQTGRFTGANQQVVRPVLERPGRGWSRPRHFLLH